MFSRKNNERRLKSSSSRLHIQKSCDKFAYKMTLCQRIFEIQFGTEERISWAPVPLMFA